MKLPSAAYSGWKYKKKKKKTVDYWNGETAAGKIFTSVQNDNDNFWTHIAILQSNINTVFRSASTHATITIVIAYDTRRNNNIIIILSVRAFFSVRPLPPYAHRSPWHLTVPGYHVTLCADSVFIPHLIG